MGDSELEQIRAKRMAELQGQYPQGNLDRQQQEQQVKAREAEAKNSILSQILAQDARTRLNSIALVKPEKASMIENMLINMAKTGQLGGKVSEAQLIKLLEEVNSKTQKRTTVKFDRRRHNLDDSD
ncbi:Programmed cell death protein 5 [Trichoplax sp. H2]|nr:Programmed cell death protein 5 [Trichoplax sp. H2]|eukprot:RDD44117.1 Programmed cell death protein 5 [Trichoplax sp. H2]